MNERVVAFAYYPGTQQAAWRLTVTGDGQGCLYKFEMNEEGKSICVDKQLLPGLVTTTTTSIMNGIDCDDLT